MSLMAMAALCAAAAGGGNAAPAGSDCAAVTRQYQAAIAQITPLLQSPLSRDAIARVAYAEAGNQGDSGLAGVVYTIINRLIDGGFGVDVTGVLNAPGQFEPVWRAGGWQRLPQRPAVDQAHIDTILNLALDGRLPDPTNGARYFQNPTIVAARAASGSAKPGLVNFGHQAPVAVIKDHAFFDSNGREPAAAAAGQTLFAPLNEGGRAADTPAIKSSSQPASLFVPLSR